MLIWNEPSTKSIFMNARPGKDASAESFLHAARNGYCAAQVLVRFLENVRIRSVEVLSGTGDTFGDKGIRVRLFRQDYKKYNDCTYYPDRLRELKNGRTDLKVPAHSTRAFRVDFFVPESIAPGKYTYQVTVKTDKGDLTSKINLIVHKAVIRDPADSTFGHEYFFNLDLLPKKKTGILPYSEEWWELLSHYADVMKEMRNNTICVQPLPLLHHGGSTYNSPDDYDFKFDLFDRFVELFLKKGAARDFTLSAFIQSVEGKSFSALSGTSDIVSYETNTPLGDDYLRTFYGGISKHINEKGWKGLFRVHIEDEPHTTEVWLHTKKIIDEAAPDLLAGEPLDMIESARVICDHCGWAVPRINVHDEDPAVFKRFVERGGELWLYSCCFPEEAYFLNKFVDLPVIRSRLMEWACIGVGAKGFLHWGFNYWGRGDSLYGFNADARFKGDGAIVYKNLQAKKLDLSARFMNTRDGLQDADLFMQIIERGNDKQKKGVRELLDEVTKGDFEAHSDDTEEFERNFEKLLAIADSLE